MVPRHMLIARSLVFNVLFYLTLIVIMVFGLPAILFGRRGVLGLARAWSYSSNWLLRTICGLDAEYRGVENIPSGGIIFAAKHQSTWETFSLLRFADDFSFILKRELTFIPLFGWYLLRANQIAINRTGGSALQEATTKSREVLRQGRQIFIFPEGTRRPAGAPPAYKFGVAKIYEETQAACVPVALNSGLFWSRKSFLKRPGTILVEFLEPIQPGLTRAEFFTLLSERLEAATNRLIDESIRRDPSLRRMLANIPEGPA